MVGPVSTFCPQYEAKPTKSTQPSTLHGMVKWVLAVVTAIAKEEAASSAARTAGILIQLVKSAGC